MNYPIGVLIMAYGGPNSLDEIPGYLADIRSGRTTSPEVLADITRNYRLIGGSSPLLEISRRQVEALASLLDPAVYKCYLGMRHWAPWLEDTVRDMLDDNITQAITIVLAPHFSQLSTAKYQAKVAAGLEMYHGQIAFRHIDSYHDSPKLIQALANRVREGLALWPEEERDDVHVIFSAHSLPTRVLKMGDPYDSQLRETAQLVANESHLAQTRWSWSYQSAGRSPEPWLGPQLHEYLPELAEQGISNVLSVPIGFVSDHVEILYDIDIQAKEIAKAHGIHLERPAALNNDPLFIAALAETITAHAAPWLS